MTNSLLAPNSPAPLRFRVLLFAGLREALQHDALNITLPAGSTPTLADALRECENQFPILRDWLPHIRVAVNLEYAQPSAPLRDGDEIALIPPVAGG